MGLVKEARKKDIKKTERRRRRRRRRERRRRRRKKKKKKKKKKEFWRASSLRYFPFGVSELFQQNPPGARTRSFFRSLTPFDGQCSHVVLVFVKVGSKESSQANEGFSSRPSLSEKKRERERKEQRCWWCRRWRCRRRRRWRSRTGSSKGFVWFDRAKQQQRELTRR